MCAIKEGIPYKRWTDLENDNFETLWLTLRPYKMPRQFSHILFGTVYHPPGANNWELSRHMVNCIDTVLKYHPYAGLLITGDFNHFKESYLTNSIRLKQLVHSPTRANKILISYTLTCLTSTNMLALKLSSPHRDSD